MTESLRLRLFLLFGVAFFALYCFASVNLPAWGSYRGPYGDYISKLAVYERHATDTVNAINYDYRGFDTLGEEFILFSSVLGVMLLLRREKGSEGKRGRVKDRRALSETIRVFLLPAIIVTVVFGFYIGVHGQLTPGGGFQAGVILATALLLIYLSQNTEAFMRITSHAGVELIEAMGAASYGIIGAYSLVAGLPFLTNILPLGETGNAFSAGNIALISACVGVEVTAAFVLVVFTYLQEIIQGQTSEE